VLSDKERFRLEQESILWVTTVRKDGQPQTHPVWFVLDGDEILVWSINGKRIENLATNDKVSAHVSDDGRGSKVLTIEATAKVDESRGPAQKHAKYVDRYQGFIDEYEWTWDFFDATYNVPVVITPTKVQSSS
jgi:PPOX class probable F420-dependent enzyme